MKLFAICYGLFLTVSTVVANWADHARFENFTNYFPNLMLETIYEIEELGWCNLKLVDQTVNVNEVIYDRHFQGPVTYTNGFLVSIEKLEFVNLDQNFFQGSVTFVTAGNMIGNLAFRDAVIGYDVMADFGQLGQYNFTGVYRHPNIEFSIIVQKNLNTSTIATSASLVRLDAGSGNFMSYLPDTDVGEILSRHYTPSSVWNSVGTWASQIIGPTIREVIDRIGFPNVCFNCE